MSRFDKKQGELKCPEIGNLLMVRKDLHPVLTRPASWEEMPGAANGRYLIVLQPVVFDRRLHCNRIGVLSDSGETLTLHFYEHWATYFQYA